MVAWASRLFVRSRSCFHGLSLGKKWKWLGHTHTETSRTRCVWGNTVVPELPSPPQRARPFHSHSIQTPASPFHLSIAKSCRPKQVHSTFRGASSVPSPWFFGWDICSSLSSSFGVLTACSADSLGQTSLVVTGTGAHPDAFHCHRVPDSFQLPLVMDSWKFIIEVHWTWSELHWSLFDIGRVFWEDRYWEIFLGFARSCTKPPSW